MRLNIFKARNSDLRSAVQVKEFADRLKEGDASDMLREKLRGHMIELAKGNDLNALRDLLEAGAYKFKDACESALIAAVESGQQRAFRAIAYSRVRLGRDSYNRALLAACRCNQTHFIPPLVAIGAQLNATAENGDSALIVAVRAKARESAFKLISMGANVNVMGEFGTALMHAAENADYWLCNMLLLMGADPHAQKFGWCALDCAREAKTIHFINKWRTIRLLEKYKESSYACR